MELQEVHALSSIYGDELEIVGTNFIQIKLPLQRDDLETDATYEFMLRIHIPVSEHGELRVRRIHIRVFQYLSEPPEFNFDNCCGVSTDHLAPLLEALKTLVAGKIGTEMLFDCIETAKDWVEAHPLPKTTCTICQHQVYFADQRLAVPGCRHLFHARCFSQYAASAIQNNRKYLEDMLPHEKIEKVEELMKIPCPLCQEIIVIDEEPNYEDFEEPLAWSMVPESILPNDPAILSVGRPLLSNHNSPCASVIGSDCPPATSAMQPIPELTNNAFVQNLPNLQQLYERQLANGGIIRQQTSIDERFAEMAMQDNTRIQTPTPTSEILPSLASNGFNEAAYPRGSLLNVNVPNREQDSFASFDDVALAELYATPTSPENIATSSRNISQSPPNLFTVNDASSPDDTISRLSILSPGICGRGRGRGKRFPNSFPEQGVPNNHSGPLVDGGIIPIEEASIQRSSVEDTLSLDPVSDVSMDVNTSGNTDKGKLSVEDGDRESPPADPHMSKPEPLQSPTTTASNKYAFLEKVVGGRRGEACKSITAESNLATNMQQTVPLQGLDSAPLKQTDVTVVPLRKSLGRSKRIDRDVNARPGGLSATKTIGTAAQVSIDVVSNPVLSDQSVNNVSKPDAFVTRNIEQEEIESDVPTKKTALSTQALPQSDSVATERPKYRVIPSGRWRPNSTQQPTTNGRSSAIERKLGSEITVVKPIEQRQNEKPRSSTDAAVDESPPTFAHNTRSVPGRKNQSLTRPPSSDNRATKQRRPAQNNRRTQQKQQTTDRVKETVPPDRRGPLTREQHEEMSAGHRRVKDGAREIKSRSKEGTVDTSKHAGGSTPVFNESKPDHSNRATNSVPKRGVQRYSAQHAGVEERQRHAYQKQPEQQPSQQPLIAQEERQCQSNRQVPVKNPNMVPPLFSAKSGTSDTSDRQPAPEQRTPSGGCSSGGRYDRIIVNSSRASNRRSSERDNKNCNPKTTPANAQSARDARYSQQNESSTDQTSRAALEQMKKLAPKTGFW